MADTAQNFDLAGLMQQANDTFAQNADTITKLNSLNADSQNSYQELIDATMSGFDAQGETPLSRKVKAAGELSAQAEKAKTYQALGLAGEGSAKTSVQLAARYHESLEQALKLSQSVKERESIGFFDNPLAYVWNQAMLPDERNALSAAVNDATLAADGMKTINQMAQSSAQTEEMYKQTISEASAASMVSASQAQINAAAARVNIEANNSNAHNVTAIAAATRDQLNVVHTVLSAKQSAEQLSLSYANNARAEAQFNVWKEEQKDTEEYFDKMSTFVALGAKQAGRAPLDAGDVKRVLKGKGTDAMRQEVVTLADVGYLNAATPDGEFKYSATPAGALGVANSLRVPLPASIETLHDRAITMVNAEAMKTPAILKDKGLYANALNTAMIAASKNYTDKVDAKDTNNPYIVPTANVMATMPAIQQLPLFQNVLADEVKVGGLNTTDPAQIIAKGLEGYKAGKITLAQLSDGIVEYYKQGVAVNNAQQQFTRYGIPAPTTYNTTFKLPYAAAYQGRMAGSGMERDDISFPIKSDITINLTDLTQVNALLVKLQTADLGTHFNAMKTGVK
jgi:hypothetical protein